jgi:hypothetical protein
VLVLDGRGQDRAATVRRSPHMPGFQLAVRMTRNQPPRPPADGKP